MSYVLRLTVLSYLHASQGVNKKLFPFLETPYMYMYSMIYKKSNQCTGSREHAPYASVKTGAGVWTSTRVVTVDKISIGSERRHTAHQVYTQHHPFTPCSMQNAIGTELAWSSQNYL